MRTFGLALLLASATMLPAGGVNATQNACTKDAQQQFMSCAEQCRDDFLAQKLTCKNIDPVCGSACVQAHKACRASIENILDTGLVPTDPVSTLTNCSTGTDACNAALEAAKGACWAQFCGTGQTCASCAQTQDPNGCYECVDPAQLTAFACRDTCRDSFRINVTVKALKKGCATSLSACTKACPPAPTP